MKNIRDILDIARSRKATDIHIVAGAPVLFRVEGELQPITREKLTPSLAKELSYALMTEAQVSEFEQGLDVDFMTSDDEHHRYRVNISYNDGDVGAVIRLLPAVPIPLEQLRLPDVVTKLPQSRKGLILITGSTSQGKTTTMAGMIDAINQQFRKHIVTIEDPIEYVHANKNSIVRQRDVGASGTPETIFHLELPSSKATCRTSDMSVRCEGVVSVFIGGLPFGN